MKLKELLEQYSDVELTEEQEKQIKDYLGIKNSKKWRPKQNERYYIVTTRLTVGEAFYTVHDEINDARLFVNNCFKTKEEAEFRLEQIKVYNELKIFADENNEEIDWNKPKWKYHITYNYDKKHLGVSAFICVQDIGQIYFSSEELVQQAIEKVGADRIKKYLFGVE